MVSASPAINVGQINSNARNQSRAWRTDAEGLGLMYIPLAGALLSKRMCVQCLRSKNTLGENLNSL